MPLPADRLEERMVAAWRAVWGQTAWLLGQFLPLKPLLVGRAVLALRYAQGLGATHLVD